MHNQGSLSVDYSQLTNDEIENVKEVEEKINKDRAEPVILLAIDHK